MQVDYSHTPVYVFQKEGTNEILGFLWANESINEDEQKEYSSPEFNLDLSALEQKGEYIKKLSYKEDGTAYLPNRKLDNESIDNSVIEVSVTTQRTKELQIATDILDKNKLKDTPNKFYLTLDNKLKESYLPKVDYSWYDGPSLRAFSEEDGEQFANNPAFDRRSEEEKKKGAEFDGWYTDAKFKNKIEFVNGFSKYPIKSDKLYPKFKEPKWDKIRDYREVIDSIIGVAKNAASVASDVVESVSAGNGIYAEIAKHCVDFVKWVSHLALGGKMSQNEFWEGYNSISELVQKLYEKWGDSKTFISLNGGEFKGSSAVLLEGLTWVAEEVSRAVVGLTGAYSKREFKTSVFSDAKSLNDWDVSKFLSSSKSSTEKGKNLIKALVLNGLIENSLENSSSSGSGSQSTKEQFEIALKIREDNSNSKKMKTKAATKKKAKMATTKSKSDIDYSTVLNTKESTSSNDGSSNSRSGSKASIIQILKFNAKTNKI